jgi:hypothetical protein
MTRDELDRKQPDKLVDDAYLDDFLLSRPFPATTQSKDDTKNFQSPSGLLD